MSLRVLRPLLRSARAARVAPSFAPVARRAFHVSRPAFGSGETDAELSAALAAEHAYETEGTSSDKPQFLQDLEGEGVWSVAATNGADDVVLSRKFGNETLKLTFQVSDLDNADPIETEAEAELDENVVPAYITSSLIVSKSGSSKAVLVDMAAQPDGFEVTNVAIFDKALADAEGAEGDWKRRSHYMGPQFDTLDASVQDAFQEYLAERGVDEALANFIVSYSEFKEQKDYVTWLTDLKEFINA